MVKAFRFFIVSLLFLVGFVCEAEFYQMEIWNVGYNNFYFADMTDLSVDEKQNLIENISSKSADFGTGYFIIVSNQVTNFDETDLIYSDSLSRMSFIDVTGINGGRLYTSVFSGSSQVAFREASELNDTVLGKASAVFFTGDEKDINNLWRSIENNYGIALTEPFGSNDFIAVMGVWASIGMVMILLAYVDYRFHVKEIAIRYALGNDTKNIEIKNMVTGALIDIIAFIGMFFITSCFISGAYNSVWRYVIVGLAILLSCMVYIGYIRPNPRIATKDYVSNRKQLVLVFSVKLVISVVLLLGISVGFSNLQKTFNSVVGISDLREFGEYYYIRFIAADSSNNEEIPYEDIGLSRFGQLACLYVTGDDYNRDFVVVNPTGRKMIESYVEIPQSSTDVIAFIPDKYDTVGLDESIREYIEWFGVKTCNIEDVYYSSSSSFTYIDGDSAKGIGTCKAPVILYVNNDELAEKMDFVSFAPNDVLFSCTSPDERIDFEKEVLEKHGYNAVCTKFDTSVNRYQSIISRILRIMSSVSAIFIVVYVLIICIIQKLYFRCNKQEIVIKYTLGYGVVKRYHLIMISFIATDILALVSGLIASMVFTQSVDYNSILYMISIGFGLILADIVVCIVNVAKLESKSRILIVKGEEV